jgi:cupin-like protein
MSIIAPKQEKSFTAQFPLETFGINHGFGDHPLFKLPAILELVKKLPRDRIEYNSGKAAVNQDPDATPLVDLEPEEIVRKIETAGAWMVLKGIEVAPEYNKLLEDALMSVATARGHASLDGAGFESIQGFLFVSSPNSTTPFHADSEDNFFVQIHGEKFFHVYDNRDRSIAGEAALEGSIAKHRNLAYDPKFDAKAITYHLFPGDGLFLPYQWPHWVKTAGSYSISLAITWKTAEVRRRNELVVANSMLRSFGLPQPAPGQMPALDTIKVAAFRTASAAVAPLRRSEGVRRALRRIVLGKGANYYYRDKKKETTAA